MFTYELTKQTNLMIFDFYSVKIYFIKPLTCSIMAKLFTFELIYKLISLLSTFYCFLGQFT